MSRTIVQYPASVYTIFSGYGKAPPCHGIDPNEPNLLPAIALLINKRRKDAEKLLLGVINPSPAAAGLLLYAAGRDSETERDMLKYRPEVHAGAQRYFGFWQSAIASRRDCFGEEQRRLGNNSSAGRIDGRAIGRRCY